MTEEKQYKCGYVTIVGHPNVGKSTFLNQVLGKKISIVTNKPQTTRDRILAVHNSAAAQVVFLDTPGIHRANGQLGRYMNNQAYNAIAEGDLCLWIIDGADRTRQTGLLPKESKLARRLAQSGVQVVVAVNKVDRISPKQKMLPLLAEVQKLDAVACVVPISAQTGDGVSELMAEINERLPIAPRLFPEQMLSDRADRFFVSEAVREVIINVTQKEVPYRTAVVIDRYLEMSERTEIFASIHVETNGQKKIIIGRGGQMLGNIRESATKEICLLLACPVSLHLHVNVSPNWSTQSSGLAKMGYE